MRVVLNNGTFHLIEPEDRRHFSHKGRKGHGHLSLICWTLQKTEILSSKSPASSPWQSCFQSRSFASWADRGKQRLEIAPIVSVRLSARVNLLHPLRKILLVPIKSSVHTVLSCHYLSYGWRAVFQKTLAKGSTMLCCFVKQQIWVPLHFIMSLFCGI